MANCRVCGRECTDKGYTTVSGQRVCSIHCAIKLKSNTRDKCANCDNPVWEGDNYRYKGSFCCSLNCFEEMGGVAPITNLRNSSKYVQVQTTNNYYDPLRFSSPGMQVSGTNYGVGPRGYDDIDMGPGDKYGNYTHGNPNWNNDDDDEDDDDDAYGDVNDQNYLNQYGDHQYVKKNDGGGDLLKNILSKAKGTDKPKNESHEIIYHGADVKCEYCGFLIKDGTKAFSDNFGKKFHTLECFSNHFQGIPKPKFG